MDNAVLTAAYELFLERGYGSVSLAKIARQAGVWTPAIYRRWKSKSAIAIDVIDRESNADAMPDTGSIRDDLVDLLRERIRTWRTPLFTHVLAPLWMEAAADQSLRKELARRFVENRQPHTEARIHKAIAAGEVRRDTSPTELLNQLMGSLAMPLLFAQELPSESDAPAIVDHLLEGFRPT